MGLVNITLPVVGQPNSTEDPKVVAALTALQTGINGNLDAQNLATATRQYLGLSDLTTTRRGYLNIATTESRTNAAYGLLTTPDRIQNVVLPSGGLIAIAVQATVQESNLGACRVAVFIGANQLKIASGSSAPVVQETGARGGTVARDNVVCSFPGGLTIVDSSTNYGGDVTTGQVIGTSLSAVGGPMYVFAAAGTYDISVQYKASAGSVTAKNRSLWVWTLSF